MAKFKCKMCGAPLNVNEGQTVTTCDFCQSKQTVANANDERKENLFNRANSLRSACDFDKAILSYQSILTIFPDEPEAYWGLCLCKYGIEYVNDPVTKKKIPTIHRASYDSILKDSDYLAALSYADVIAKEVYQEEAKQIAEIQQNILSISQKEDPFDIFICYKETTETGQRTPDSVLAQEVYSNLIDKGYKVFFSRITLESKLGSMYEPYIFAALNSAKIMLVFGTKKEYFEAVWVKNEWSRFIDMMKTRPDHYLIPCYRDMDAYEMPEQFLAFQGQDMNKLGFMQDLLHGVDKIMGRIEPPKVQTETKIIQTDVNISAFLKRSELLIGDGNFDKADELLERVLNNDPTNSQAYLLKLLIEFRLTSIEQLKTLDTTIESNKNFKNSYNFGDGQQKNKLSSINDSIKNRLKEAKLKSLYDIAIDYKNKNIYSEAIAIFLEIHGYRDSDKQVLECTNCIYEQALTLKNDKLFTEAIELFKKIGDYKDSKFQITDCEDLSIRHLYEQGCEFKKNGDYDQAIIFFKKVLSYQDSEHQIHECERLKKQEQIYVKCLFKREINPVFDVHLLERACQNLKTISGFKDADTLLAKYEGILSDYQAKREEAAKAKAKRIKKAKIISLFSGIGAIVMTAILLLNFLYFVPLERQNNIQSLINSKRYDEAIGLIEQNNDFGDSKNLLAMCNAGKEFDELDYEKGIDYIYNIGGTVDVNYDGNGGIPNISNEQIKKAKGYINNEPNKTGYKLRNWVLTDYTINAKNYYASINLKAEYDVVSYSIVYYLNGGTNNPNNPSSYTIEDNFTFTAPSKTGYTFLGWFDEGGNQVTSIDKGTTGNLALTAHWNEGDSFTVTLDANGGSVSETLINVQYDHSYSLPIPTRLGYTFDGWYDGSTIFNNAGTWNYTSSKTLLAHWTIINYSINYILNGGTNNPSNPSSYTIEDNITFGAPTKTGYTFLGWFDEGGNQVTSIDKGTTGNLALTAHWNEGDLFTVTLDANGGSVSETLINVQYDHSYSLPIPTRSGYTFNGWFDGSTRCNNAGTWKYTSSMKLIAHWTIIYYRINYILNGGTNNPINRSSYTIKDNITFAAPTKTGYTFLGWFSNDAIVTEIPFGSTGEVNIEAKWSAKLNSLSITSEDTSKGTVAITSGSGYSNETITVVATPADGYAFKGWYHKLTKVSDDATYTFIMPTSDYSLVAHFFTKAEEAEEEMRRLGITPTLSEDGKTITYGLYPQTNVNDSSLISSLNSLTTKESNGWYLYDRDYYAKFSVKPDNLISCKFDNGTTIKNGTTYWFKCEPIVWNVLSNNNGEYFIVSSVLLDANRYNNGDYIRTINGQTIYPNNYKYSDIRKWLNEDFYNSAFALGSEYIQTTTVDNSASTTDHASNEFACDNTEDKVFLPSYKDYINSSYGFSTSDDETDTRCCRTTDWVRARGASYDTVSTYLYNGVYRTRSPCSASTSYAWLVSTDGNLYSENVMFGGGSVRPCISIKIA